jgi:origin recognition complex subunit 3
MEAHETDIIQGSRHLNYDLQILHDYVQENLLSRVVLSFQDSEAFEGNLIADLVDVLKYVV